MQYEIPPNGLSQFHYRPYAPQLPRTRNENTMTIIGNAEVKVQPDQALITVGIITENMDVKTAQEENSLHSSRIISALKQMGIESEDIKTTVYSIQPKYDHIDGKSIFTGYEVLHTLQVFVRDLSKLGMIYDLAIRNGANQVGTPEFQHSQSDKYELQVLSLAVNDAVIKARQIADTLSVNVNHVPSKIREVTSQSRVLGAASSYSVATMVPPIQTGEISFHATVETVFQYF